MTDKPSTFDIKFDSAGDFDKARELIERMNAALAEKDQRIEELEQSEEELINERDEMEERVNTICEQLDLSESDATWSNLNDPAERACEYIAAKDRRIADLESEWRVREGYHQKLWNDASDKIHALKAQIDRVRALVQEHLDIEHPEKWIARIELASKLLAALGEPAATPERNP